MPLYGADDLVHLLGGEVRLVAVGLEQLEEVDFQLLRFASIDVALNMLGHLLGLFDPAERHDHLDGSLENARRVLGDQAIIGRSTHSQAQALAAEAEGFDYIGVGPVFSTPTKPAALPVGLDLVRFAAKNIHVPFVAIGGIDSGNVEEVRQAGAKAVAVVRAVMADGDPKRAARKLVEFLR